MSDTREANLETLAIETTLAAWLADQRDQARTELHLESPIEQDFVFALMKWKNPSLQVQTQVTVPTPIGEFRLDVFVRQGFRRMAFECDGARYHDEVRDLVRDAFIVVEGHVDELWRFRGADIHFDIADCMAMLAIKEPRLFDERGVKNWTVQASDALREALAHPHHACRMDHYLVCRSDRQRGGPPGPAAMVITRRPMHLLSARVLINLTEEITRRGFKRIDAATEWVRREFGCAASIFSRLQERS